MSFVNRIFGVGAGTLVESVGNTAKVFVGDKSQREMARHIENMATSQQFAAEFQYRGRRNWFDSLIDGMNRLPRPLITFSVLAFFPVSVWMIFQYPAEYRLFVEALAIIPSGMWALFSMVVGFYFAGRMQIKAKDFKVDDKSIDRFTASLEQYNADKAAEDEALEHTESSGNATLDAFRNERQEPTI